MEFKDKILLYCFREVKFKQGFTTGTSYYLYISLDVTINMCIIGLMVSESELMYDYLGSFPGLGEYDLLFNFFDGSNEEIMGKEQKEEVLW